MPVILLFMTACEKQDDLKESPLPLVASLSHFDSGYDGSVEQWRAFLVCWRTQLPLSARAVISGTVPTLTLLSKYTLLANDRQPTPNEIEADIARLESRLRLTLPRSYKEFLKAYLPPAYYPHPDAGGGSLRTGILAPTQVAALQEIDPALARMYQEPQLALAASDQQYYIYGIDQDDVAVRTQKRPASIVVGWHGPAHYDLIVLYPDELTADGEMEAAMIMHSGEFRALSFAELMRQLSQMETTYPDRVPPYAQDSLVNTCAWQLRPRAVSWR